MKHANADKYVFCHEALHLRLKRQSASFRHDVERWESDTDSEGSQDEDDFTVDQLSPDGFATSDGMNLRFCNRVVFLCVFVCF